MKINVEIVLRAVDRASKEVGKLSKSFKEVGKAGDSASKQATGSFRNIDRGAKNSTKAINNVNSSLGNLGKGFTSTSRSANSFTSTLNKSMRDGSRAVTTLRTSLTGLDAGLKRNSSTVRQTQSAVTGFGRTAISTFHQVGSTSSATAQRMASSMSTASREMSNSLMSVQRTANLTGDSINRSIITGTRQANTGFSNLSRAWSNTTSALRKGISSVVDSFGSLNGAISGAIAGFGTLEMASIGFGGAMNRQLLESWMRMKISTAQAREYSKVISEVNMKSPAPSSFINQLLSGAVVRQTNLSAGALKLLGQSASDYFVASQMMGKSAIETQMDLIEYIQTGNTSQLERDSIIKNQIDKLKDQATVEARIKALNDALVKEGYKGISQLDSAKIKFEEFKGRIEETLIVIASRMLPVVDKILTAFNNLDSATGGWASTILVVSGGFIAVAGSIGFALSTLQPFTASLSSITGIIRAGGWAGVFSELGSRISMVTGVFSTLRARILESAMAQRLFNAEAGAGIIATLRMSVASGLAGIKNLFLAGATNLVAGAQALLNAVMSMNPIVLVIIAITGLIAVLLYLWKTNEGFRQAVMKLWGALQGLGNYIMGGLRKAWDDFMKSLDGVRKAMEPFISAIQGSLTNAFNTLKGGVDWVISGLKGLLAPVGPAVSGFLRMAYAIVFTGDGARMLIDKLGPLGYVLAWIINPIRTLFFAFQQLKLAWDQWANSVEGRKVLNDLGVAFNQLKEALRQLGEAFQPVIDALKDAWGEFSKIWSPANETGKALKKAGDGAKEVGDKSKGAQGPLAIFVEAIKVVAWILQNVVIPALRIFIGIITFLTPHIRMIASAFAMLIGALTWLGGIIWQIISTLFALQSAFTSAFGGALASAFQFISGIISFPGQVLGILWQVITGQISWSQAIQRLMSTTAMRMVMGFIRWLMGLPGRVFSILLQVISRVTGFSPRALSSAGKVGANIIKGLVQKVSEAPGKVWSEMLKIGERIMQAGSDLYNKAKEVGKKILNGLLGALGIKSPGYMYYAVSGELTRISKEFKNRTGEVKGAVEGYGEAMVNSMRGSVKLPVPEAKVDVSGAVSGVNETVSNVAGGLKGVTSISADAMKGVINTTQEGIKEWTGLYKTGTGNIQSVMDSGLKKVIEVNAKGQVKNQAILKSGTDGMVKTTKSGLESIKRSWNDMKGKVVASANATKTQVTSHISTLGGNIKRFYRLVQNPGGAGGPAGPGPIGAGFMRGLRVSVPCSTCSAPPLPLTSTNGEALTRPLPEMQRRTVRIKRIVEEYMKSLKDPRFGFGWDYSGEWIPWVKEKIGSWPVNFLPGLKVKVGDFATWPPRGLAGNLIAFRSLMSAIIGRTRYAFYYGSSGLSPAELIRRGAFNCYDGARIVTAYARAFGLPASIRCGLSWNGIRHCAANVGGMWFDTTAFQHGYGWTSPAVKGYGGGAYVESALKTHARAGAGAVVSRDVGVSLDHNVTLEVKVKGDGVSASEVKSALTDKGVIDGIRRGLVEDEGFKSRLLRVIGEAISREERYYGL